MSDPAMSDDDWERPDGGSIEFSELLDRYYRKVFNVLLRLMGDYHEAADLTQDVFVQAYRALSTFRGEAKIYTWLYKIAVNRAKNRLKQLARQGSMESGSLDDPIDSDEGLHREVPDELGLPDRALQQRELQAVVNHEIGKLPPDFRLVIILRDLEGLSYREMADVIGISLEAVKSRLFRARSHLRERLTPYITGRAPDGSAGGRPKRRRRRDDR